MHAGFPDGPMPQNRYFRANCINRGFLAVEVIVPNVLLVTVVFGLLNCGVFVAL